MTKLSAVLPADIVLVSYGDILIRNEIYGLEMVDVALEVNNTKKYCTIELSELLTR